MRLRQEQIPQAQGIKPFYSLSFSCEMYWRVSEKSFPQSASPTLRYILPSFGCRSPLRRPYSDKISHKQGLAVHEKPFSDTLRSSRSRIRRSTEGSAESDSSCCHYFRSHSHHCFRSKPEGSRSRECSCSFRFRPRN